jgi:hypothetical protein
MCPSAFDITPSDDETLTSCFHLDGVSRGGNDACYRGGGELGCSFRSRNWGLCKTLRCALGFIRLLFILWTNLAQTTFFILQQALFLPRLYSSGPSFVPRVCVIGLNNAYVL